MTRPIKRAVVTGGAGFLGGHLCERLLAGGVEVTCVDNFATAAPYDLAHLAGRPGFGFDRRDVSEGLALPERTDTVFHLACPASPKDYARLGVETLKAGALGTMHALDAARAAGARFILASSSEVYGDPLRHPQREDYWGNVNPVGPRSVYDEAKRYAEALTTAYRSRLGTDTGIVRIFNTYGPRMRRDDGRMIPNFITQALAGEPLTVAGDGSQTRSICHVDDTVSGLIAMAAHSFAGPVNIGNDEEMTVLAVARLIRDLAGSRSGIEFVPLPGDDPAVRRPDIALAAARLHWRPVVPAAAGLRSCIRWYARHSRGDLGMSGLRH